jgi:hypothetical protein
MDMRNGHAAGKCGMDMQHVEHEGLVCLACDSLHRLKESTDAGVLPAVMISDQSFLPIILTGDGRCVVAVVRVENSRLFEIKNAFKDIFLTTLAPHGKLPVGNAVLVGSLSRSNGQ